MPYWLADARAEQATDWLTRFDPRYWTVNFPRPMMAAATNPAADVLRVDAVFYRRDDLAGIIWESEDRHDHPLLGYDTARDYRACRLRFRWRSAGVRALDQVDGPTLTIEGRDAAGTPRAWYVRLWNYARGTPEDAEVTLDFAALDAGFALPADRDPVWAGDVDRLFVSLVAPGYDRSAAPLDAPAEGWAELSAITVDGAGAVLAIGDVIVPAHDLRVASGYDDHYHLTPARLLRNALQLGYRGAIDHYVGMSHYFRLEAVGAGAGTRWLVSRRGGTLNVPCAAWHADLARRAARLGYELIWSLSYELLDRHCWDDWKQRDADGAPAFDWLQLEDYEWVTGGATGASERGAALVGATLGYPAERQEYLAGFVPRAADRARWAPILAAAAAAKRRGVAARYLWALPQVLRDGLVYWQGEDDMDAFDDVLFPLALGREAEVAPGFSTAVTTSAGGHETRTVAWAEARTRYDVGPGVRSEADIALLLAFYRARQGSARGFRLRDPFDWQARDVLLGVGDGATRRFALVTRYGDATRRITRPVAGTVRVAVAGAASAAFTLEPLGVIVMDDAPAAGAAVTASFDFDVPVRFAEDRLSVARATYLAGSAHSVPVVELREA